MASERDVWYVMVFSQEEKATWADKVKISPDSDVDDFRDAVHAKSPNILAGIVPLQLRVFANKGAFDMENPVPLGEGSTIGTFGISKKEALFVVVPTQDLVEPPFKKQRLNPLDVVVPQIDISGQYVNLPLSLLQYCCVGPQSDILLYRRPQVNELWKFLADDVIAENWKGFIVGPPGTGKSLCTLSYMASLDRQEWCVIWVHLNKKLAVSTCLRMGTNKSWSGDIQNASFVMPKSPDGKKIFVCLDGYNENLEGHKNVLANIMVEVDKEKDRVVVCSSMPTLGKRNHDDEAHSKLKFFFMHSWSLSEYKSALTNPEFYELVKDNLDATSPSEVNQETSLPEKDAKIDLKYYYAGGSCRFMFQFRTNLVKTIIQEGVESARDKTKLIQYCSGKYHQDEINRLYGMKKDREDLP